jgi:hypothetical protein
MHVRLGEPAARARLDLVLLGLLLCWSLWLRIAIATQLAPDPAFAFGPDGDDWAGVFLGASRGWPMGWDAEWSYKYPLLPLLALVVGRAADVPLPCAALWACLLTGALVAPLTYLLGRPLMGRPAALAAAGWMVVQDGLASHASLTTAYALVPALYLLLLLGLSLSLRDRGRLGGACALVAAALLTVTVLHGLVLAGLTLACALLVLGLTKRRWRPLPALAWPTVAGLVLGRLALLAHPVGQETPGRGALVHLWEEVAQTLFHDPGHAMPTGHQVHRLVAGASRWDHLLRSQWELFNLPLVAVTVLAVAGVVALVLLARRGQAAPRMLLPVLLGGVIYGFVANSEDFHVFHWYPVLALVIAAGLAGWRELIPGPRMAATCWAAALALLAWQALLVPRLPDADPRRRYLRVARYYGEYRTMHGTCAAVLGPVSARGTLLVDQPMLWSHRAHLDGAARLVRVAAQAERVDPSAQARPVFLVSEGAPPEVEGKSWAPLLELEGLPGARLWWLDPLEPDPSPTRGEAGSGR